MSHQEVDKTVKAGTGSTADFIASGHAASLGSFFGNIIAGAKNLLNYVTFYQMKERAGKVGSLGLNPVLKNIKQQFPSVKLHLIGHSFGGRVVTAATAGTDANDTLIVDTLTLLQAAFSHYAFAENYDGSNSNGFFRNVITKNKVTGPIIITQTHNDTAVGLAYALASRISNTVASAFGDVNDKFGGLGGNGALKSGAITDFNLNKNEYNFQKGNIYNLNGDSCIKEHSDICHDQVGKAIMASVEVS